MNILNNRNKRTNIFKVVALCLIAAVSFTIVSCDDDMDIQQSYPFTVEVMPVPNKVTKEPISSEAVLTIIAYHNL